MDIVESKNRYEMRVLKIFDKNKYLFCCFVNGLEIIRLKHNSIILLLKTKNLHTNIFFQFQN